MSIVAIFMALLLISMHACNARSTPLDSRINKNVANEKARVDHEMDVMLIGSFDNTRDETFSGDTSMAMTILDESQESIKIQDLERNERSIMQKSKTRDETENPRNAKDDESLEDAVVMDYVTPHRKSPIHNHLQVESP